MKTLSLVQWLTLSCLWFASQDTPPAQDPALDNLVHAAGYQACAPGQLGAVVETGSGPIDMVMVTGFGLGASAFAPFMERIASRFHMFALTLPGFEGSAAPPMPPPDTSYGEQTWTRAAAEAVAKLIGERKLARPVLVGHSLNGTQVAARVAIEHPELARALVLLAGTPYYEPVTELPNWKKGLTREQRAPLVDRYLAKGWFKTVTRTTWDSHNFNAADYSVDTERGARAADLANQPPLPVLIRYLCEFHAGDTRVDLARLQQPLLMIQPAFTEAAHADPKRNYLLGYFEEPWKGAFADRPHTKILWLEGSGVLVMDDKPAEVDAAIADFLKQAP